MFERVRSRPSPGAGSNARSGCLRGDSEECRTARAVTEPTYVCSWSSSTHRRPERLRLRASIAGTRTGKTVGRHKSQRAPGGPGSQGRRALTTGSPGVDSAVAGPTCEHVPVGCCAESASPRLHPRLAHWPFTQPAGSHQRDDHASRNSPIVHSEPPSITAAMSRAKSPPMSPTKSRTSPS